MHGVLFKRQLVSIRSRTSRQIYRLALSLHAPEWLFSLSKSQISIFNTHLVLFVQKITQLRSHYSIGKYCHLKVRALPSPFADQTTKQNCGTTGEE